MQPIANYTDLKASVARWLNRADLTDDIPGFIRSAESQISIDLRLRQQLSIATLQTTPGFNGLQLPPDFLEFYSVSINGRPLEYTPLHGSLRDRATGTPHQYTVAGDNLLLSVPAESAYPVEVAYFGRFDPLETTPTNGLLTNYPDVYLSAALMCGFRFVMNEEKAAQWQGQYIALVERLKAADKRALYNGPTLRMRTR